MTEDLTSSLENSREIKELTEEHLEDDGSYMSSKHSNEGITTID